MCLYFQTLHDRKIVEEKMASGEYTYVNANDSKMEGIELMSSFNLGQFLPEKPELEAYANFTWILKNDFTQLVGTEMLTRNMQYVRNANGNFGLKLPARPHQYAPEQPFHWFAPRKGFV